MKTFLKSELDPSIPIVAPGYVYDVRRVDNCGCECGNTFQNPNEQNRYVQYIRGHGRWAKSKIRREIYLKMPIFYTPCKCEKCGQYILNPDGRGRYYSCIVGHASRKFSAATRKKMSISHTRYLQNNPEADRRAREKASRSNIGKHSSPEATAKIIAILKSPERRQLMGELAAARPMLESTREKLRTLWKDPVYRQNTKHNQASSNGKHFPSELELITFDLLQMNDLSFEYTGCSGFNIGGFIPDFINFEKKVIVECYGAYWHALPERLDTNVRRKLAYEMAGYKLYIIWEYELLECRNYSTELRKDETIMVAEIRSAVESCPVPTTI